MLSVVILYAIMLSVVASFSEA